MFISFPMIGLGKGFGRTRPILRINTQAHKPVKARIRPITDTRHQAMFHGIPMDVITMFFAIPLITDLVFPKTLLPKGLHPFPLLRGRARDFITVRAMQGDMPFYSIPTHGIIRIARRQSPDAMQVVGQQYKSVDGERMPCFHQFERPPQKMAVLRFAQDFAPPESDQREEISGARRFGAAVLHDPIPVLTLPTQCRLGNGPTVAQHSKAGANIHGIIQRHHHI